MKGGATVKKASYFIAIFTLFLFLLLLINFENKPFIQFDKAISDVLFGNDLVIGFHVIGETSVIATVALILLLVLWLKQRNYRGMFFVLMTIGLGRVLNQLIKNWVDRPRPEVANVLTSFSFPSGHAMIGLLYLFTIAYLLSELLERSKKAVIVWVTAIILTLLTGLSRIAESHHYATDVIAGWCIGYTWFVICVFWYEQRKKQINMITNNT